MAASLQERLNYLVNYSSQLIFVGGETQLSQTKALESFLFQQSENTEIAYISAEPNTDINEFRKELCQQLLGQSSHFYHRPLNECLSSLNTFTGPIMIAITRAELLPKKLLQELWELVLQSRFAGNKQHLNVVLFASKQWAKEAKSSLPANDSGTPLLLSTEQASQYKCLHNERPNTSIDADSETFTTTTENTKGLTEQNIEQRPLIRMGAFWAAAVLFLLSAVIGTSVWQKGGYVSTLFTPLANESKVTNALDIPQSTKETVINWKQSRPVKSAPATLSTVQPTEQAVPSNSQPTELAIVDASVKPTEKYEKSNPTNQQPIIPNKISPPALPQTELTTAILTPFYQPAKFVIQFAAFRDPKRLNEYQKINNLASLSHEYSTIRNGKKFYILTHNVLFDSKEAARQAITTLPNFANKRSVFIKSTDAIIKELRVNQPTDTLASVN